MFGGFFVNDKTPIFLLGSIGLKNGGLTNAAFMRANLFAEYCEEVPILTINFHRNLEEITEEQYKRGALKRNIKVYNLFSELDPRKDLPHLSPYKKTYEEILSGNNGEVFHRDNNSKVEAYRVFQNGVYKKYMRFENKKLTSVDYFDENWIRTRQEIFDNDGNLIKIRHMDVKKNKPLYDRYLSRNGVCYLTVVLNSNTGENLRFYLHEPEVKEFSCMDDILVYWLNRFVASIKKPIIMCEKREHVNIFKRIEHKNAKKYFILHNNHFAFPHTKGAPVDPSCYPLFDNLQVFDKVILLTEEQKRDIVDQYGKKSKFVVIHHIAKEVEDRKGIKVKPQHAVSMARYAHQKALHEAIHAFKYVVDELPNATYSIYGYGELKDQLQQLINELNLQNNVFLEGFSLNALDNYRESVCSIMTSKYEGFPLFLLESLAAGTPIVSYRNKYGPEDIIRDGIDGFLVDIGDRKALADRIIRIMKDPDLYKQLSKNGPDVVKRFNYESYRKKWLDLLK